MLIDNTYMLIRVELGLSKSTEKTRFTALAERGLVGLRLMVTAMGL